MTILQETWNQIRDLYAGMPPGTRVVAGLLTAVLLVSLLFLVVPGKGMSSVSKDVYLYGDYEFTRSEQVLVDDALGSAGLKDHTWQGNRLKVPSKRSEQYALALSKAKAVPEDVAALALKTAMGTTVANTEKERQDRDFASKLYATTQTIRRQPWADDATVLGDSDRVFKNMKWQRVRTASVTIRPVRNREVDKNMRAAIVGIVKSSLGITDAENIAITDAITGRTWKGSEDWFEGGDGGYLEKKRDEEFAFEQMILTLLSDIPDLKVTASANVDKYKSWEQLKIEHDKKTIILSDEESRKTEGKGGAPGYRPGYEVQDDNVPLPIRRVAMNSTLEFKDNQSRTREAGAIPGSESQIQYAPFPLRGISASIRVPYTHFLNTWKQRQKVFGDATAEPQPGEIELWITEEITRLKNQLYPHLRMRNEFVAENADLEKLITIEPYHTQDMEPLPEETSWQKLSAWFGEQWKTMGLFVLVAASLGVLWGVTRPQKPEPIIIYEAPEMPNVEPISDDDGDEDVVPGFNRSLEPFNKSMRSLQEEVSDLVNENPDAAASVLRQWIGRVAPAEQR
jgi:flagellar M-ring protein FliF